MMNIKDEIIGKITEIAGDAGEGEAILWERIKHLCDREMNRFACQSEPSSLSDIAKTVEESLCCKTVFKTGIAAIDNETRCFSEGELVVIAGRPAMGTTQLLINIALNISNTFPTLYLSLEEAKTSLYNRALSVLTELSVEQLKTSELDGDIKARKSNAIKQMDDVKLLIDKSLFLSYEFLETYLLHQIREHKLKVIIIDFLQALIFNHVRRYNRDAELDEICRRLRQLAETQGLCIVAGSAVNRSSEYREDKIPHLSDLRDSGGIELHSSEVFFVHRPERLGIKEDVKCNDLRGVLYLCCGKHGRGRSDPYLLRQHGHSQKLSDFEQLEGDVNFEARLKELDLKAPCPF